MFKLIQNTAISITLSVIAVLSIAILIETFFEGTAGTIRNYRIVQVGCIK